MLPEPSRRIATGLALVLMASLVLVPTASAGPGGPEGIICGVTPLWDAAFCWVGVAFGVVNTEYTYVTCNIIGGPVCGFNICDDLGICLTDGR